MNRAFLMLLLVLNLLVMGASGFVVWERVNRHFLSSRAPELPAVPVTNIRERSEALRNLQTKMSPGPEPANPPQTSPATDEKSKAGEKKLGTQLRKVLFRYRDSVPKSVEIAGEFNQWSPQPMKKGKAHRWSAALQIEPGEYAYNFIVDGKMIRDPSNRKIKKAGRKIPSSLLIVK
jgi:hypothetical protein